MSRIQKLLLTLCVVGVVGSAAGFATFAAFSSTTSNTGNTFDTGTVTIADNDSGAMYTVAASKPGQVVQTCIKVTYTGSLPADVELYTPSTIAEPKAQYVNLTIDKGTGSGTFPDCTGFTADANGTAIFNGTLAGFATAKHDYATGVAANPAAQSVWNQNDAVVYRFTLSVQDTNSAQGMSVTSHAFTWEAHNH